MKVRLLANGTEVATKDLQLLL
ncbi:hypothetical protein [Blautia obeum]